MCLTYGARVDERMLAMFDLFPPDIGSASKTVRGRLISLADKGLVLGCLRRTTQMSGRFAVSRAFAVERAAEDLVSA